MSHAASGYVDGINGSAGLHRLLMFENALIKSVHGPLWLALSHTPLLFIYTQLQSLSHPAQVGPFKCECCNGVMALSGRTRTYRNKQALSDGHMSVVDRRHTLAHQKGPI